MSDPLAGFWVHPCVVRRRVAGGRYGETFAEPVTVTGFVEDGQKLVTGAGGKQLTSSARVAFPAGTAAIPLDSEVTLPALFGGRTCAVIATAVGDAGGQPTPNHLEIALL